MPNLPPLNYKKLLKILPIAASIILTASYVLPKFSLPFSHKYEYNNILVTYIADGDTIKIEDGSWVRLIGIDAPEYHESEKLFRDAKHSKKDIASIKKMGALSKAFAQEMLTKTNKRVRLEFDLEKRDKYNRLLAYVFLKDGTFANAKIIASGYAKVMTIPPNVKYADMFVNLQREAKAQKKGLWADNY